MMSIKRLALAATAVASAILVLSGETMAQVAFAYVPNAGDGTVSAIDLKTDRCQIAPTRAPPVHAEGRGSRS